MLLSAIASHLGLTAPSDLEVTGLTLASHDVAPGDLFIALPGAHSHGAAFIDQAHARGAVAVLTDAAGTEFPSALPTLVLENVRPQLGELASWFYGQPSQSLSVMGVTGTNGKTTTAFMMEAAVRAAGVTTGLIGTVETRVANQFNKSARTTPEATELQRLFHQMVQAKVSHVAMEVSSHALALHRVAGTRFAVAGFTNLSQDHLDFHGDMESYYQAKAALFTPEYTTNAVINVDDEAGRRLLTEIEIPALAISTRGPADWYASEIECTAYGSKAQIHDPFGRTYSLELQIPGRYNIDNALMAIAMVSATGVDTATALTGIAQLAGVPGRMERVAESRDISVIVDYAHTPDAVEALLHELKALTAGRVIAVLGCGGDRDASKRPLMGRAVAAGADVAVLTSDNPRSEDPMAILSAMEQGARSVVGADIRVDADRRTAIAEAISLAHPGDCVVIAGKGHEQGQEINGEVFPFDDRDVAREALRGRR